MSDHAETITQFVHAGVVYDLDHLGRCRPDQAGTYAIYRDDQQILEFTSDREPPPPGEPIPDTLMAGLIHEAIKALIEET